MNGRVGIEKGQHNTTTKMKNTCLACPRGAVCVEETWLLAFPSSLHGNIGGQWRGGCLHPFLSLSFQGLLTCLSEPNLALAPWLGVGRQGKHPHPDPPLPTTHSPPHYKQILQPRGPSPPRPPRPTAQALLPLPPHNHKQGNAILVLLLLWPWSFLLGLTRPEIGHAPRLIDRSAPPASASSRIVFHTPSHDSPTTHTPYPLQSTQRQDGPTTGGAGPGGRGLCLGLRAHASPFHRRATSAR